MSYRDISLASLGLLNSAWYDLQCIQTVSSWDHGKRRPNLPSPLKTSTEFLEALDSTSQSDISERYAIKGDEDHGHMSKLKNVVALPPVA